MDIQFSELLEFLHEFKHGGKQGIQALLGAIAEPVLNNVYMRDHRPPGTAWYSTAAPDAEDWRDATLFESSLAAADSLKEYLAVRNGLDPATLRNGTPKRVAYPDMITLASSFAEWYELKPALVENGNRNAKWRCNSSHKKSFDLKAASLANLTQTFGLRPMDAGQRVKDMMNGESMERIAIPLGDDITIDDVRNILDGDVNAADFQATKRITASMLRQLTAAVVSSQGYYVRFKWHLPGLLLWRLTDQGDTEEKWQQEFNHRVVPVPPPVTVPQEEQQHDLVYERLIEAVRVTLLVALTIIAIVAIIWFSTEIAVMIAAILSSLLNPLTLAVAGIIAVAILTAGIPESATAAPMTIAGQTVDLRSGSAPVRTLLQSVGDGGANAVQDVHYVQVLLNGWRAGRGEQGIRATGLYDAATAATLQAFIATECGKSTTVLQTHCAELGILHARFLENLLFADTRDDFPVLAKLKMEPGASSASQFALEAVKTKLCELMTEIHAHMPQSTLVPPPEADGMELLYGDITSATRLLNEIKSLTGDATPTPGPSHPDYPQVIYDQLHPKVNAHLAVASTLLSSVNGVPRKTWSKYSWPDMRLKVSCDWNYDTIVIHHSGDGLLRAASDTPTKIERLHREDNGWADIGYHFIIDRQGVIHEGRSLAFLGAHVRYDGTPPVNNERKVGIIFCGDFEHQWYDPSDDEIEPKQVEAAKRLVAALRATFPITRVVGHGELDPETECPGMLRDIIPSLG